MRWREKLFPGSRGRVLASQWSCWFTFVSSTPLLKVVTRRVTFDLVERPNFQKDNLVKAVTRRVTFHLAEIPTFQKENLVKVVTRRVTFHLAEMPNFQKENLVKAVTRRVTYFLDEIPDFQSKIRGVGFLLPVSPAGRGWSRPLATSGCAALPGACAAVCPAGVEGCNGCSLKACTPKG